MALFILTFSYIDIYVFHGPPTIAIGFNTPNLDIMKNPPQKSNDSLIDAWVLFCYLVIGVYVGLATVHIFSICYTHESLLGINLAGDGHKLVRFSQLRTWDQG